MFCSPKWLHFGTEVPLSMIHSWWRWYISQIHIYKEWLKIWKICITRSIQISDFSLYLTGIKMRLAYSNFSIKRAFIQPTYLTQKSLVFALPGKSCCSAKAFSSSVWNELNCFAEGWGSSALHGRIWKKERQKYNMAHVESLAGK